MDYISREIVMDKIQEVSHWGGSEDRYDEVVFREDIEDIPSVDIAGIIANEDLSLDELGEIVNEALAKIYSKLRTDIGMHYPIGIISSLGEESYNVDVRFVEGESRNTGEYYDQVYCI
jgi:hypothetical protein